ncbi:DUF3330 domain-containing protein [Thiohalospira sp.]|uniref:DUF3330 domain-containing protein n=1 Tax=Thiohalospira sp. TaxID=3080549 RepID=UPI00397E91FF
MATNDDNETPTIACEVCLTEVPASVAQTAEGPDYVQHFCGLDCLERWQEQGEKTKQKPD